MEFNNKPLIDEESEAMRHRILKIKKFFWQRMSDMVLGPDHEYVYLKRLMKKFKEHHKPEVKVHTNYKLSGHQCK